LCFSSTGRIADRAGLVSAFSLEAGAQPAEAIVHAVGYEDAGCFGHLFSAR
jgi:hypothetical protein